MPSTRSIAVAKPATFSDSPSATHAASMPVAIFMSAMLPCSRFQKTVLAENRLHLRGHHEIDKTAGFRPLAAVGGFGNRIADRLPQRHGEGDPDLFRHKRGVGGIDKP